MSIDFSFPEELQLVISKVRDFCDQVVRPAEKVIDDNEGDRKILVAEIIKMRMAGGAHPELASTVLPRNEQRYTEDGMPRMRAVSFSIALTDNTPFNGPLMLIPGSHKTFVPCVGRTPEDNYQSSLKKQELGVPNEQDLAALVDRNGIKAPTGPAGSLIIFECNTLHASNANMSPWPRSNLFFVYNSVENQLEAPYCGNKPRPDFLGNRTNTRALAQNDSRDTRKTG